MKIALICSHGGHLTELLYLMDAFDGHDKFFITYDNIRTRNLKYRKYLFPNFGEKPYKMFFNIHKIINILLKEKPDLIISNGSEIALPFFYLAKIMRIKTIFIECYTRINTPTITGRWIYPVSDTFLVLWPEMLDKYGKKAQYWGGIFDLDNFEVLNDEKKEGILVITGMHTDFTRLVKKMDEIAGQIDENVLIQLGQTEYLPKNAKYFRFKDYDEIKELIKNNKIVICQGAMTVMDSLTLGTPVISIPRLKEYGEHINDHQLIFVEKLKDKKLIKVIKDTSGLNNLKFDLNKSELRVVTINKNLINHLKLLK